MSSVSKIEWTGATWNPMRGCNRVGPDCDHCYMMTHAHRFEGAPGHPYELGSRFRLVPDSLTLPLRWTTPTKVFVNSMSDFFHQTAPVDYLVDCARVMGTASWHIYQVLTKRSQRLRELLSHELDFAAKMDHIWWGVSVGLRDGLHRIADLRAAPAKNRFLSLEPLLEDLGEINLEGISWVIVGGESGRGARPIQLSWVTNIRDQCRAAGVPFFFKQWGGVHKGRTGRLLDGVIYDEFPPSVHGPLKSKAERDALIFEIERKYGVRKMFVGSALIPMQPALPQRVQMSRRKGWRKPGNTVYVGRPGKFGNPFSFEEQGREQAIRRYEAWIQEPAQEARLNEAKLTLRGKNLGCWCRPELPCHANVLLRLVNES